MKRPRFDKVLLTGTDEELDKYVDQLGTLLKETDRVMVWTSDERKQLLETKLRE